MHWLIKCSSNPATDALRMATIDAHRQFLDGYPEVTWYSGPLFTDDNRHAIGSLRLIEFPDRGAALAYIDADPYTRWMYTSLERVGESTESPFEGNANDVPISQMCLTAEIDLRGMLGETDLPPPLEPRNNIVL